MEPPQLQRPLSARVSAIAEIIRTNSGSSEFSTKRALLEVSKLIYLIVQQARKGDPACGYFLGETLPILQKQCPILERTNQTFRKTFSYFEAARMTTAKGSPLRRLIHRVISEAEKRRRELEMTGSLLQQNGQLEGGGDEGSTASSSKSDVKDDVLKTLPELSSNPEAVAIWTELVVYPELREMADTLPDEIKTLKKATDLNGKFQISLLKRQIQQTVARIAAVPRQYYSNAA